MTELALVTPELEKLDTSKAEMIRNTFVVFADELEKHEKEFEELIQEYKKNPSQEVCNKARKLRLVFSKIRTSSEKKRKEVKEEFLRAGKAIDGVQKIIHWGVADKEEKLLKVENHFAILEQERLEKLQSEREELLAPYVEDPETRKLSDMEQDVWEAYLSNAKQKHEDRIAAEKKAKEEREEAEKQAERERLILKKKSERIRKFAKVGVAEMPRGLGQMKEKEFIVLLDKATKVHEESQKLTEIAKDRQKQLFQYKGTHTLEELKKLSDKEFQNLLKNVKTDYELQQEEIRNEQARKTEAENAAKEEKRKREEAEAKLRAKQQEEEAARLAEEKRIQKELNMSDSGKVEALVKDLEQLKTKYTFKSKKYKAIMANVVDLLTKVVKYINQ